MELGPLIFVICLLLPGIWMIVAVRRYFKERAATREQSERAALAQPRLPAMASRQALRRVQAIARRQVVDPWKNMTPSVISAAFKSFYRDDSGESFDSSMVSAAFEKFTEEIRGSRASKAKS